MVPVRIIGYTSIKWLINGSFKAVAIGHHVSFADFRRDSTARLCRLLPEGHGLE